MANTSTESGELRSDVSHQTPAEATKAKRDAFCADILADPEKYRRQWDAEERAQNPHVTQEQLDASWEMVAELFGL